MKTIKLVLGVLLFCATHFAARAQVIYTPGTAFFQAAPAPQLYNQFVVGANNGSSGPGADTASATPNSGAPSYKGTVAPTGPFNYSRSVANGATFPSFLGTVTATESASMSASANFGSLSVNADATETGSFSDAYFGDYGVTTAGQPNVQYTDTITITPTEANPAGTTVPVTFTVAFSQSSLLVTGSSPANVAELLGTLYVSGNGVSVSSIFGQSFQGTMPGNGSPNGAVGYSVPLPYPATGGLTYGNATSVSNTVNLQVGTAYVFTCGLYAIGQASATYDTNAGLSSAGNSISESADEYTLINTYGLGYNTVSGTVYLTVPPVSAPATPLGLRATADALMLSWPASAGNFRVQQCSDLNGANWVSNSIPINLVDGTNQVTISPSAGNMFFRLASP